MSEAAEAAPRARSPVDHRRRATGPAGGSLELADWTPLAKVLVRAGPEGDLARTLGVACGRAARDAHGTLVARFAPDEWLLFAEPGTAPAVAARVEGVATAGDGLVSVVGLTSGRAALRLTGERAPDVVAKVCAVDVAAVPDGGAFRSYVAGVVTEVVRDDRPDPRRRSYLLACDWSFGAYLFDTLADAGAEFGLAPGGHLEWAG